MNISCKVEANKLGFMGTAITQLEGEPDLFFSTEKVPGMFKE